MSNPLDDLVAEFHEKRAFNFGGQARTMGHEFGGALRSGAALGTAAAVTTGVGMAASKVWDAVTKAHDFRSMLGSGTNEDVRAHYEQNPTRVNEFFTSLRTMNPQFSKDPVVAGSYMRQMLSDPEHAGGRAELALQSRDKFPTLGMEAFSRGALEGGKAHITESAKVRMNQPNEDRAFGQRQDQHAERMGFDRETQSAGHEQRERQMAQQGAQNKKSFGLDRKRFDLEATRARGSADIGATERNTAEERAAHGRLSAALGRF